MSKKRIITLFVSLCTIIILCVLGGVVFVVQDIEIVRADNSLTSNDITNDEIISKANISIGKSIFAISESKVVSNIETNFPTIKVKNIERVFPNKIIIKITERVPLVAIKFKDKEEYLVLDNNMCAIDKLNKRDSEKLKSLCIIEDFELQGVNDIVSGKQLPTSYGKEVVVTQHILAQLSSEMDVKEINNFMSKIRFINGKDGKSVVCIKTKYGNSGATIVIDYTNLKNDKNLVKNLTHKAYQKYTSLSTSERAEGYLLFDKNLGQGGDFYYIKEISDIYA